MLPEVRDLTADDLFDLYDVPGPHVRAGFVASVDGAISVDGRSGALSSPADKAVFRALRTVADAVVVGAGTARTENYGPVVHREGAKDWRAAHDRDPRTPLVVVSRTGRIPPRALEGPVLLAAPEGVPAPAGVDVIRTVEPRALVTALHDRGLSRLLCEGGPALLTALLRAGVLDELCLTTSPTLVGSAPTLLGDLGQPRDLRLRSLVHDDPGVLLVRWDVVRSEGD
ncbi:MAG: dihydrofolate reductase family protein [Mycobacteriales bacterium]